MRKVKRAVKAWAIANKSGIGFVTCPSKTVLGGKPCRDYIIHTCKKNAQRDFDELYNTDGIEVVEVSILIKDRNRI